MERNSDRSFKAGLNAALCFGIAVVLSSIHFPLFAATVDDIAGDWNITHNSILKVRGIGKSKEQNMGSVTFESPNAFLVEDDSTPISSGVFELIKKGKKIKFVNPHATDQLGEVLIAWLGDLAVQKGKTVVVNSIEISKVKFSQAKIVKKTNQPKGMKFIAKGSFDAEVKGRAKTLKFLYRSKISFLGPAGAPGVSLSPIKDNTLYEAFGGSLSNGAGAYFFAGSTDDGDIRRGVIQFDIAGAIPAGSTITSVTLTLHMSRTIVAGKTVALHRLLADWGEGTSNAPKEEGEGAPSSTDDATWIHTFYPDTTWDQPGGDFSPAVSASAVVGGVGFYTWGSTPQMVADVRAWLDDPANNFGWLITGDEASPPTAKRFDARENGVAANRPLLTVDFTSP